MLNNPNRAIFVQEVAQSDAKRCAYFLLYECLLSLAKQHLKLDSLGDQIIATNFNIVLK